MGIFSKIKDAIFGKAAAAPAPTQPAPQPPRQPAPAAGRQPAPPPPPPKPQAVSEVDVEATLNRMAEGKTLNWHTSIVDLMKLVGMESSLAKRKELAQELGYTGALDGSAEMNIWLHKRVLKELAANGGKVPASLLD